MPALPLDEAGKYVAAAYVVFFTLVVVYVAIMAAKISRIDREVSELLEIAEAEEETARGRGEADAEGNGRATGGSDPSGSGERDGEPVA